MNKIVGKNSNVNPIARLTDPIPVGGTTSVKLLDAQVEGDLPRIKVIATNHSNVDCWIKFQAATVDNDKKGFLLYANSTMTLMEDGDTYSGEISAIADTGGVVLAQIYLTDF